MLTHDPKLDDPALKVALASPAFYVGALGSKSTQAKRRERLLNDGLTESQLARLHAPIGLDIGAESPEEIALAIMAQVVEAHRRPEPSACLGSGSTSPHLNYTIQDDPRKPSILNGGCRFTRTDLESAAPSRRPSSARLEAPTRRDGTFLAVANSMPVQPSLPQRPHDSKSELP